MNRRQRLAMKYRTHGTKQRRIAERNSWRQLRAANARENERLCLEAQRRSHPLPPNGQTEQFIWQWSWGHQSSLYMHLRMQTRPPLPTYEIRCDVSVMVMGSSVFNPTTEAVRAAQSELRRKLSSVFACVCGRGFSLMPGDSFPDHNDFGASFLFPVKCRGSLLPPGQHAERVMG